MYGAPTSNPVEVVYREESRRVLATLIRLLGDFELAEEALQEAFAAATEQWPKRGVPHNPRAWLVSAGRFRAIDAIRRRARHDAALTEIADRFDAPSMPAAEPDDDEPLEDDRLRLIFTCCHPAIAREAQLALALREVCGLTTEEIAHAFLIAPATLAQRIVRAKKKIRSAGIPYEVPGLDDLPDRLHAVLKVVYLVYNEGYLASSGETATRADLTREAILLGRLIYSLLPEPEAAGLLAMMLFTESRRSARTTDDGDIILLEDQDRSLWDREMITEGSEFARIAMSAPEVGVYALQAAISAEHASATSFEATNWNRIVALYDLLLQATPSPVVELNRAAALAMRDGPAPALSIVDALLARGELDTYHLAHATRADLCRRLGLKSEARASYERALTLAKQEPERRFLERRIREVTN